MMWRIARISCLLALCALGQARVPPAVMLVRDSKPVGVVVLPAQPDESESAAATELIEHVEKISDAKLDSASADATGVDPLPAQSRREEGTRYVVSELLEQLGVRWFMPGDLGTVISQQRSVTIVGRDVMAINGHSTYLAQAGNAWILCDTYPHAKRLQHPYLYHMPTNRRIPLGRFPSPRAYRGEWRCDTHPRSDSRGTKVVVDSPHNGGRQLYLVDIARRVAPAQAPRQ